MLLGVSCSAPAESPPDTGMPIDTACISRIFAQDDSLGTLRNHASEKEPLSSAIRTYLRDLQQLDFRGCPPDFTQAYTAHRMAWEGVLPITDRHQHLRGEMHDLFDQLEHSSDSILFRQRVAAIWSTWDDVEKTVADTPVAK
jgi:hypothetical protein